MAAAVSLAGLVAVVLSCRSLATEVAMTLGALDQLGEELGGAVICLVRAASSSASPPGSPGGPPAVGASNPEAGAG